MKNHVAKKRTVVANWILGSLCSVSWVTGQAGHFPEGHFPCGAVA